ncbi:hypothetical protein [Alkalilimnicola ehrlichii]|uniref:hypothetical protein n=1 Tax=Alkalilimnicola ehrlichii TaxID=351052 RepID=UPI0011C07E66|nr:hypothetical protein [Alkalilimnicola ehrlichii]
MSLQEILRGAGSALNIWPDNKKKYRRYTGGTDFDRIKGDWVLVGKDIQRSCVKYGEKKEPTKSTRKGK